MPVITLQRTGPNWQPPRQGLAGVTRLPATSGAPFVLPVKDDVLGGSIAAVGDILRMKAFNGTTVLDNWLQVMSRDTTPVGYTNFTVERRSGTPGTFPAGAAVVNYKQANQGWIYQTADDADGPFFSVRTHAGVPWATQTEQVRLGNLRNTFDYSSTPTYGFSAGVYAVSNTSLAIEAVNGIRIFNGTTMVGQWDTTGNITVGQVAANKGNLQLSASNLRARINTITKVDINTNGDVYVGSDISAPGSTYFSIFSANRTYNTEAFLSGDMLIGDNSALKANMKWDKAAGQLKFRGGTTTQAYVDTSGAIVAGAGAVTLNSSGLTATQGTIGGWTLGATSIAAGSVTLNSSLGLILTDVTAGYAAGSSIKWKDSPSGTTTFDLWGQVDLINSVIRQFMTTDSSAYSSSFGAYLNIQATSPTAQPATVNLTAGSSGAGAVPSITLVSQNLGSPQNSITLTSPSTTISGGLNVGSATGAGTGQIKAASLQMSNIGSFNTYTRLDQDANQNSQGLWVNALWNGDSPSTFNYINTGAYGGTASRLTMSGSNMSYDQASGGTNPLTWVVKFAIAAGGGITTNGSNQANGVVATAMSSLGPVGSHTTIQEWLKLTVGGNVRYIPMF